MEVKAKINLICETEKGVSTSSGKPWTSKEVVLEVIGEVGVSHASAIACKCKNEQLIAQLETCQQGDVIDAKLSVFSRGWVNNKTQKVQRSNDVTLEDFVLLEPKEF